MARAMAAAHGNRASTFIATAAAMADSNSRYILAHVCVCAHARRKGTGGKGQGGKGRERTA